MAAAAKKKTPAPASKPAGDDMRPRLSRHPRAQKQIREAKAWGGLVGFALVALLSLQAGQPLFDAGLRALAAGVACYVVAWAMAVSIWSHLARAEVKMAEQRIAEQQAA